MKIAMLLDNAFTEMLPYPKRVYYEAKSLVKNGHDVTIFCKNEKNMNLPKLEIRDGIQVKRVFDYFLGTTMLIDKYLLSNIDLYNSINEKYDVYHCHDTNTWPIGYVLANRDGAKYICETHEYFPDYVCGEWYQDSFKYKLTKMLVNVRGNYIKYANKIITVSDEMSDKLYKDFSLTEKPVVLYNTRPITYVRQVLQNNVKTVNIIRQKYHINDESKILLFQGLVEPTRGLDLAIKLLEYLDNVVLIIAGQDRDNYARYLKDLAIKCGVENKVKFTGFLSSDDLLIYSFYADYVVYFGKNIVENMNITIPNKIFDYIMVGKPIICSNLKSLARLIEKHDIGLVIDFETDEIYHIAYKIEKFINNKTLIKNIEANIRNIQEIYSWEKQEETLVRLYASIL